jgi:hypothetical protein
MDGLPTVHMNLVPMLIPHAPSANAPASPSPSTNPPDAMNGILISCAALRKRTKLGICHALERAAFVYNCGVPTSFSPTWPAHSKPSILKKSTPSFCAESAWRTVVHLCRIFISGIAFNFLMMGPGEFPAVSTIRMPSSMMICAYAL